VLVKECLVADSIEIMDGAENAEEIIHHLSEKLAEALKVDADTIEQAVLERERTRTTALPNGAAIPHCRLPKLKEFAMGLVVLRQPVRWDNEGHAVDTIMMIAGPVEAVSDHLRVLANASQLLDSPAIRAKLKSAPNCQAAYELVDAAERALEDRRSKMGLLREIRRENGGNGHYLTEVADQFEW
jgi:mannitol/fructose-specific phosphotransferase system IIA component (Ntr-type)